MLCLSGVRVGGGVGDSHFGDKSSMAGSTSNHSSVIVITAQAALAAGFINVVPAGQLHSDRSVTDDSITIGQQPPKAN